ncbi:MAG: hypothetical protein ACI9T9_000623, partial [Oleiphilaceae bacterium]
MNWIKPICLSFFKATRFKKSHTRTKVVNPPFQLEALEPKVLLSAELIGGVVDGASFSTEHEANDVSSQQAFDQWVKYSAEQANAEPLHNFQADTIPSPDAFLNGVAAFLDEQQSQYETDDLGQLLADAAIASSQANEQPLELIIIDPRTPDYLELVNGVSNDSGSDYLVFMLDAEQDGIQQVTELLAQHNDLSAVHLISHGTEGSIQLGSTWLNTENMGDYAEQIKTWEDVFDDAADILIYGCDLAGNLSGEQLIQSIAELTGADVAASIDVTGANGSGGDWALEYNTGDINTTVAFSAATQTSWASTLAITSATNLNDTISYTEGAVSVPINNIVVTESDGGEIITAQLTLADISAGALSTGTFGSSSSAYDSGTGIWTITGSVTDVNAALATLVFVPTVNSSIDTTIETHLEDSDGAGPASGVITLDITPGPINGLLLSTNDDIAGGTTPGLDSWTDGEVLEVSNPNFNLEPGTTDGSLSSVINFNDFNPVALGGDDDVAITAMHIVTTNMTLGSGTTFDVLQGDLLLATNQTETLSSTNTLTVEKEDIFVFRPDAENDYSSGTFHQLLTDLATSGEQLNAISLIEQDVLVGGDTFTAGSIIFAQQDDGAGRLDSNIYHAEINQAGASSDYDVEPFIVGSDINMSDTITGLDLLENDVHIGNVDLAAGNILISIGSAGSLGDNNVGVAANDVAILDVSSISSFNLLGIPLVAAEADASLVFEGEDIDFTGAGYEISAVALGANEVPEGSNMNQIITYTEGDVSVALGDIVVTDINVNETITATLTLAETAAGTLSSGTFGASTSTYTVGSGVWMVTGSITDVNAALAAVTFTPVINHDTNTTITTHIEDGSANSPFDGTINLNVTAQNDAPTATNLTQVQAYTEGDTSVALDGIVITEIDTGETVTATLRLADTGAGVLTTGTFGASTSTYSVVTGVWTVTGTVTDVNTAIAAVAFTPDSNHDTNTTITTHIEDAAVTGPSDGTITLNVTAQDDAPTATNLTQVQTYTEDASNVALDDIVITEVDSSDTVSATLMLDNAAVGLLTTGTFGASTSTYNSGTGIWAVNGTVSDVNAALAAVAFTPAINNDVNTSISTHIEDATGTGPADGTISLNVTAQNDAPAATNLTQVQAYTEGASSVALDTIVITDLDTGETVTANLTLANTAAGVLSTGTFGASSSTYNSGSGAWTVTGTVANVNAALAAVAFTPATNNDINTSIRTHIGDATGTGPADGTISLNVTAQNDAPAATNLTQVQAYTEGASSVALDTIVITDLDTGETVTANLTLANTAAGVLST